MIYPRNEDRRPYSIAAEMNEEIDDNVVTISPDLRDDVIEKLHLGRVIRKKGIRMNRRVCVLIEGELFKESRDNYVIYSSGFRVLFYNLFRNGELRTNVLWNLMTIRELVHRAINDPYSLAPRKVVKKRKEYKLWYDSSRTINRDVCVGLANYAEDSDHWLRSKN